MSLPDNTPVLVGIGTACRREEDYLRALEPMDLMLEAVLAAGKDSTASAMLAGLQYIAVPRGRWSYSNPAGAIAHAVGAGNATTVLTSVGVLQQTLIGEACAKIARGEVHTALVAGADAGYRLLRAQIAGQQASERQQEAEPWGQPDIYISPKDELRHAVEKRAGLQMPVGLYAIMESAFRASKGWTVPTHLDQLAAMGEGFSQVASENPHSWQKTAVDAAAIREASSRNPLQAFPYTRSHCSTWNVDQAGALLFCSAARAEQLGVPRGQWIFPVASTESNHMVAVSARADLAACPGARITGLAALNAGDTQASDVDLIDLYSCFPFAVEAYADALDIPLTRALTVTGGMAFAGGPYNNYLFQATCRAAELLRQGKGRTALVSCVSGVLTKQAFGLWSVEAPPRGFINADLSDDVAREVGVLEVVSDFTGPAKIAGYTVLHGRGQLPRGIALVDTPQGQRAMTTTENPHFIASMQIDELVGQHVHIEQNTLIA